MQRYFLNSVIAAFGTIFVTIIVSAHAAYANARFSFPGKDIILFLILTCVMIPGISILIPVYLISCKLGLHNTYVLLIFVFSAWQTPAAIWLLKSFFETISPAMEESALIDGCSRLKAFYLITAPLSIPGLGAVGILVFVYVWNNFLLSLTLTATDDMRLIPVGLYAFVSDVGIEWQFLMAGVVMALSPVLVFFLILQKRFIQGLTSGALKG
jgi:ABC-type glycerol-3-phosphate transport system permease component